jgi:hypothetical protein
MLLILASIAGILLGLIFNVTILLPVIVVGATVYAVSFAGQNPGATLLAIVILSASVQAGYVIGLTCRDLFAQIISRLNIAQSKRI